MSQLKVIGRQNGLLLHSVKMVESTSNIGSFNPWLGHLIQKAWHTNPMLSIFVTVSSPLSKYWGISQKISFNFVKDLLLVG